MKEGTIALMRETRIYQAGFCIMKGGLSNFSSDIELLHPNEISYFNSLKYDRRKLSYLLGRISAKNAISQIIKGQSMSSIFIDFGIFLFPVVKFCKDQNIQVSITHCDKIGISLAFPEEHPLGIDVEKIDPEKMDAMKSQTTLNEFRLLEKCNLTQPSGLTMIWTMKEGLSKIFRTGMMMDFNLLEIASLENAGMLYMSTFKNCAQYKAISSYSSDYVCSVIVPQKTAPSLDKFWEAFREITA